MINNKIKQQTKITLENFKYRIKDYEKSITISTIII
jgi:hypothetical protein